MNAISSFEQGKRFLVYFHVLERYEELDEIALVLERELGFAIRRKIDGPDSRIWYTRVGKTDILLINNDPYGNFLRTETDSGKALLKELLPKLNEVFARFLDEEDPGGG